jgi:hypothetical protein
MSETDIRQLQIQLTELTSKVKELERHCNKKIDFEPITEYATSLPCSVSNLSTASGPILCVPNVYGPILCAPTINGPILCVPCDPYRPSLCTPTPYGPTLCAPNPYSPLLCVSTEINQSESGIACQLCKSSAPQTNSSQSYLS